MKNLKKKTAMIAIGAMTVIPILSTTSVLAQVNTNKGGNAILALEQSYINRLKKRISYHSILTSKELIRNKPEFIVSLTHNLTRNIYDITERFLFIQE